MLHDNNFKEEDKIADDNENTSIKNLLQEQASVNDNKEPHNEAENNAVIENQKAEEKNLLEEDIHKVLAEHLDDAVSPEYESSSKLSNILKAQFNEFKKPVEENTEIPIEVKSYHTVDYFASQGIKVDAQIQDKLGKQVLRFTDWLKQMKRINSQPADLGTESELEKKVIDIASHSNEQKEVITEAMAEVLEKQGKIKQAKELYEKLSLLHPDKSVYFAARILNLKG